MTYRSFLRQSLNHLLACGDYARMSRTARRVRREHLTYLSPKKLVSIESVVKDVLSRGVPGDFVECGVALGGSGIVLASHSQPGRAFLGYDLFGMIPRPGPADPPEAHERFRAIRSGTSAGLGGHKYYGYEDDLLSKVRASFRRFGVPEQPGRVELKPGLFENVLYPDSAIALAHIDSDWYESVSLCLERVYPLLSVGGYIIADDYRDFGGCVRACHEFLARVHDVAIVRTDPHLVLQRHPTIQAVGPVV